MYISETLILEDRSIDLLCVKHYIIEFRITNDVVNLCTGSQDFPNRADMLYNVFKVLRDIQTKYSTALSDLVNHFIVFVKGNSTIDIRNPVHKFTGSTSPGAPNSLPI